MNEIKTSIRGVTRFSGREIMKALFTLTTAMLLSGCLAIIPVIAPSAKNIEPNIGSEFPYESKFVKVLGSDIHYIDEGNGPTVILIHGNPTSSYLWRNIIPHLTDHYRVIAPDLIGMGKSDKPDIPYRFDDHTNYFAGFVEALALQDVALVLHDWGGGIGLDYAAGNSGNVRAIALMEAVVKPMNWSMADAPTKYMFKRFRDPEDGHKINAVDNYFVEKLLPMMAGRDLSPEEMEFYSAPYPTVESRKPVAQWPREIPFDDGPDDNVTRIGDNYHWLTKSDVPVLALHATPGLIFQEAFMQQLQTELPRMQSVNIGSGLHYLQEVQPTKIGKSLVDWLQDIDQ